MPTTIGDAGWSFTVAPTTDAGVVDYTYTGPDSADTFEARLFGQRPDGEFYFAGGNLHVGNVAASPRSESQALSSSSDSLYRISIYDLTTSHTVLEYDVDVSWVKVPTPYDAPVKFHGMDASHHVVFHDLFVGVADPLIKVLSPTPTHEWAYREDGSGHQTPLTLGDFFHQRTPPGGIKIVRDEMANVAHQIQSGTLKFAATRHWSGIGGFLYVPSFPQLQRRETVWPIAT